jgi:hypothetical protein
MTNARDCRYQRGRTVLGGEHDRVATLSPCQEENRSADA